MKKRSDKLFLAVAVPLLTLLVAAAAVYICSIPQLRLNRARRNLQAGSYQEVMAILSEDNSPEALQIKNDCQYLMAQKLYQEGEYEAAYTAFLEIKQYRDAPEQANDCLYQSAVVLFAKEDYEGAFAVFLSLNGYRDSLAYIERCHMIEAEQLLSSGSHIKEAIELFLSIGSDAARLRAEQVAMEYTRQTDPQKAIDLSLGYTEEEIAQMNRTRELLESRPVGVLAAGFKHTVGIAPDGRVLACGDNTKGQCDVGSWSRVSALAAGAEHTLALLEDGRVVACGDNSYGQCEVSLWQDVKSIAAGDYDSFALTNSGQLLHTGFHAYPDIASWSNIAKISAGGHVFAVLLNNGRMLATHPSSNASQLTGLSDIAVHTGYALGLSKDGTLLEHGIELPALSGIIAIAASPNRILVLDKEAAVFEYPFQERDRLLPEQQSQVVCFAMAATHIALVKEDGRVVCFGNNDYGQCDTEQWVLRLTKGE